MKKYGKLVLGGALGAAGLALIFRQIDFPEFLRALQNADYRILLCYAPFFFLDMIVRAFRWTLLFSRESRPHLWPAYTAMMIGNAANIFTPVRGGDVLRAVTFGIAGNRSKSEALGTVLVERVTDLAVACLLMVVISPFAPFSESMKKGAFSLGLGVIVVILAVSACGLLGKERTLALIPKFLPVWLRERLEQLIWAFVHGMQNIAGNRTVMPFVLSTCLIWFLEGVCLCIVLLSLNVAFSPLAVGGLLLFSVFGAVVPGPPGQVGVFEYAVAMGAAVFGISQGFALAFLWHGVALLLTGLLGAAALLYLKKTPPLPVKAD